MIRVKYPKRWDETNPTDFYEGWAEKQPDGQYKCKWDGVDGVLICDPKMVIIIDQPKELSPEETIREVLQIIRECNTRQIRIQLMNDFAQTIGGVSRFDIIRSFFEAAHKLPKFDPPDEA